MSVICPLCGCCWDSAVTDILLALVEQYAFLRRWRSNLLKTCLQWGHKTLFTGWDALGLVVVRWLLLFPAKNPANGLPFLSLQCCRCLPRTLKSDCKTGRQLKTSVHHQKLTIVVNQQMCECWLNYPKDECTTVCIRRNLVSEVCLISGNDGTGRGFTRQACVVCWGSLTLLAQKCVISAALWGGQTMFWLL